jgi:Na+/H+ antiporter NhaD/arsenite permease-like protein
MITLIILLFLIGYLAIAFEHILQIEKASIALLMGTSCWVVYALSGLAQSNHIEQELLHHMSEISGILFFILGAMTIVELIDSHEGFDIIINKITTTSKRKLLWTIGGITFVLSALLDNLTTAIVMMSMITKLISQKEDRWKFGGIIIICANAGGAFSPLGDVTTTMLWVGNQITALSIMKKLLLPSIVVAIVPLLIMHFQFGKSKIVPIIKNNISLVNERDRKMILYSGILLLVFVPIFKTITHLPPFMGILFSLSLLWLLTTFIHKRKDDSIKNKLSVFAALQKIDTPSILFFLGILLTVGALQSIGFLKETANFLNHHLQTDVKITGALGILSAIVDNVPLVAAAQGMYSLIDYGTDHNFWNLLALTTGTGGSMIIIGSAAGVAVMGIEPIPFIWYLKKMSWLAAIGFILGILTFIILN